MAAGSRAYRPMLFALIAALSLAVMFPFAAHSQPTAEPKPVPALDTGGLDKRSPKDLDELKKLEGLVKEAVKRLRPTVVGIRIGGAGGSGTFISEDGYIATAAHVTVRPNQPCQVWMADGTMLNGKSLGQNRQVDYSLIKVDTQGKKVPFVNLGDSNKVTQGQWMISMGHPLGTETAPFRPPVVRLGRVLRNNSVNNAPGPIVVDGPLISGDSGGPLFDMNCNLVGINVSIQPQSPALNNASPINQFKGNLTRMKAGEAFGGSGASLSDLQKAIEGAYDLADAGKFDEAEAKLKEMIASAPSDGSLYYHLACCYLRWMQKESGERQKELRKLVFDNLNAAIAKGWDDINHITNDPDMTPIRGTGEFKALIRKMHRAAGNPCFLGLSVEEAPGGVLKIRSLSAETPAADAGLLVGDVILDIDGKELPTQAALRAFLQTKRPDDTVTVRVLRAGQTLSLTVVLGGRIPTEGPVGASQGENKSSVAVRSLLKDSVSKARQSLVKVSLRTTQVGFGVVVKADGLILVKNSDLGRTAADLSALSVLLNDGTKLPATRVATDDQLDLALLKINARGLTLTPATFGNKLDLPIGSLVASVGTDEVPISIGVRSLTEYRTIRPKDMPMLGITGEDVSAMEANNLGIKGGAAVTGVSPRTGAATAGLRIGDIIWKVDNVELKSMEALRDYISTKRVGDTLTLEIYRNQEPLSLRATLGRRTEAEGGGLGVNPVIAGPTSRRMNGFGEVLQHDCVVTPTQCGSLVVDLNGTIVGFNIARADRTKTYAIPAPVVAANLPLLFKQAADSANQPEDF